MKCLNCSSELKKAEVDVENARDSVISYQCSNCDYYNFEPESAMKIIKELK